MLLEKEMYSSWTQMLKFFNLIYLVITVVLIFAALTDFKYEVIFKNWMAI